MNGPKVSIIICNYNYGRYIENCINSALCQSYGNVEIIVVDDGSTDDSVDIVNRFGDSVTLIRKANGGQISAYNYGFDASSGDILFFLDSDDAYDSNLVERVISSFADGVAKVHFGLRLFNELGDVIAGRVPRVLEHGNFREKIIKEGYLYCSAPGSGNAYARWAIEALFPLPILESDKHGADFYLIYAAALFGDVVAIDENIASYRIQSEKNADKGLIFGNSAQNGREPGRQLLRSNNFRQHILKVSHGEIDVPLYLSSFPVKRLRWYRSFFLQ